MTKPYTLIEEEQAEATSTGAQCKKMVSRSYQSDSAQVMEDKQFTSRPKQLILQHRCAPMQCLQPKLSKQMLNDWSKSISNPLASQQMKNPKKVVHIIYDVFTQHAS